MRRLVLATLAVLPLAFAATAQAADPAALQLTLRNNRFEPPELKAPAGVPIEITLKNEDRTAEEFESKDLKVEKVVAGGKSIVIKLRALTPGRYKFFGEFHESTAQGVLVVEAAR
jgi:plastocyanin